MASTHLLVKANSAVLSPSHEKAPAQILVDKSTGKIVDVAVGNAELSSAIPEDVEIIELKENQLLVPGLVDAHGKYILLSHNLPYPQKKKNGRSIHQWNFKDRTSIHGNHLYLPNQPTLITLLSFVY